MKVVLRSEAAERESIRGWLRAGQVYVVLAIEATKYRIETDVDRSHTPALFDAELFEVIDDTPSKHWVDTEADRMPPAWAEAGFWEAYFDGDGEARAAYQHARDRLFLESYGTLRLFPRRRANGTFPLFIELTHSRADLEVERIREWIADWTGSNESSNGAGGAIVSTDSLRWSEAYERPPEITEVTGSRLVVRLESTARAAWWKDWMARFGTELTRAFPELKFGRVHQGDEVLQVYEDKAWMLRHAGPGARRYIEAWDAFCGVVREEPSSS